MSRACLLTLAVVVLASPPSAQADMGAPGLRLANVSHRVVTAEAFPDHVFVIYRPDARHFKGEDGKEVPQDASEAEYAGVAPDRPLLIHYDRQRATSSGWRTLLIATPRAAAVPYNSALDLVKAVESGRVAPTVRYEFPSRESVPEWQSPDLTITYRLQRVKGSERLEVVRETWDQGYQCCVAATLFPTALALGGLYLIRRWRVRSGNARLSE